MNFFYQLIRSKRFVFVYVNTDDNGYNMYKREKNLVQTYI